MDRYALKKTIDENPEKKLRDIVAELIYDDIINLRICPGTKLNVNQMASELGISRTPVAEAVAYLTDIGFVVQLEGVSGSYVMSLDMGDMINLYRVRDAIESEAAALCAHTVSEDTIYRLNGLAEAFKTSVMKRDIPGMKDTDMPFHRLLIEECGNPYIMSCYESILPRLTMYQSSMLNFIANEASRSNPWLPNVTYNHTAIVSAIRMRIPELARRAMSDHIDASLSFLTMAGDNAKKPF
ncbi:MAG: GntR family transcriptional regulator [Eubacteriales bacterium]|nr:GntR family transcriptional regulator [Eubacteriales bacterium]